MRKYVFVLLIVLVLVSACTWDEFEAGVKKVFLGANKAVTGDSSDDANIPPEKKICADEACIREAFSSCEFAEGELDSEGRHVNLSVFPGDQACIVEYVIMSSTKREETGKTLACVIPKSMVNPIEEIMTTDNLFCTGTLFDLIPISVEHDMPGLNISKFVIEKNTITFSFQNQEVVYLKSADVLGLPFTNCSLEYKNPVKVEKKSVQRFTLGCEDILSRASRISGIFVLTYYLKPDFKNATTVTGMFVGEVVKESG